MDAKKLTHDPEPWDADTCRRVEAGQQTQPTSFPYHAVWDVNYARAMACVNAMAGIADPAGFITAICQAAADALIRIESDIESSGRTVKEGDALRAALSLLPAPPSEVVPSALRVRTTVPRK